MAWNAKAQGPDSLYHDIILNRALCIINDNIISFGGSGVEAFGLPKPSKLMISEFGSTEMSKELSYNQDEFCNFTQTHEPKLNGDQSTIYYAILHTIHSSQGVFCLLMHVVALKKLLLNRTLAKIRSLKSVALAVASSGICWMGAKMLIVHSKNH